MISFLLMCFSRNKRKLTAWINRYKDLQMFQRTRKLIFAVNADQHIASYLCKVTETVTRFDDLVYHGVTVSMSMFMVVERMNYVHFSISLTSADSYRRLLEVHFTEMNKKSSKIDGKKISKI